MLGFLCEPAIPEPGLTGRELEVAELVAEGLPLAGFPQSARGG